ncbi:MAG: flippase-like domain-containing protein [Pelagibacterales bacterium]|nr:flippase-like domain-containing protein [Pelagibacterales bacterium]
MKLIINVLKYLVSIILLYLVIDSYGVSIYELLLIINYKYILLIFFISFLQYSLSAYRWMYISKHTGLDISFSYSLRFYYISNFMNNILPGGIIGDIYRIYHSAENKNELFKMGKSFQSVVFERLSGQIMLFGTFLVSLTFYFFIHNKFVAFLYLFFPSLIIIIMVRWFLKKKIKKMIENKQIGENFFSIFTGAVFWNHLFLSFLVVSSYILIYIIAALSLGLDIDYLAFLVFTPIILFSMTLPISIGGWGIRETTALFISFLLGLSANVSISVAIIYGLLSLICSLPGLILFLSTKNR